MTDRRAQAPFTTTPPRTISQRPSYASVTAGITADPRLAWELHSSTDGVMTQPSREQRMAATMAEDFRRAAEEDTRIYRARDSIRTDVRDYNKTGSGSSWRPNNLGCTVHEDHPPFSTPSYLRRSRHAGRLLRDHERHVAELREQALLHPNLAPRPPSLSASSSHASLSKMHGVHLHQRPAVQDVVERPPPHAHEDASHPLPVRWSEDDKMGSLEVMADGTEVRLSGPAIANGKNDGDAAAVRADHPMPKEVGLYYFEVTILTRSKDGEIAIGFETRKAQLNRLPGWEAESWGYHSDDGHSYAGSSNGKKYAAGFTSQDVVGCGVNFRTGNAFFTKNGISLGTAFTGIKSDHLYPAIGVKKTGEHLRANFGRTPFVYDIDRHMENEFVRIMDDVNDADVSSLSKGDDEQSLIQKLVGQYLAHEGYVETAKAFAQDVREQQSTTAGSSTVSEILNTDEDDVHAVNRQKIRQSILNGDIDRALKYTTTYYPRVLEEERNRDIYFRLRCRKFIELMRHFTTSVGATSSNDHNTNGHPPSAAAAQMDLDDEDQPHPMNPNHHTTAPPSSADVDMDASQELPAPPLPKPSSSSSFSSSITTRPASDPPPANLLNLAIACGQELQHEFGADARPHIKKHLHDLFAIIAYPDPAESPIGPLLDPAGRMKIAEEVNGAILVSLGKPSSAALEKLCAQTEAFLDEAAARTGGAAAFVNVRKDLLA